MCSNKQRLIFNIFLYFIYVFVPSALANTNKDVYKYFETPAKFIAESTVFLNEVAAIDREAGFKIKSELDVEPVWRDGNKEILLKFQISKARIWVRKLVRNAEFLAHPSVLDKISLTPYLVHWKEGLLVNTYIGDEDKLVVNYKKSLASLFQFQIEEGETNETDASGSCDVLYETMSPNSIRKIKNNCKWSESKTLKNFEDSIKSNLITLYTFSKDNYHIEDIFSDEIHRARISSTPEAPGVKARGWVQLTRANSGVTKVKLVEDFNSALEKWGPLKKGSVELTLVKENDKKESLSKVIQRVRTDLSHICEVREDDIGTVEEEKRRHDMVQPEAIAGAEAILLLARAFRSPSLTASNVQKVLENEANSEILWGILLSAGASGSNTALSGVLSALKSDAPKHRRLLRDYLTALATSKDVTDDTIMSLLRFRDSQWDDATKDEALLAVAAASTGPLVTPQTSLSVKDSITKSLSKCADSECRSVHYRAVGNLKRADTIELLLQAAEKGDEALDALDALSSCDPSSLLPKDLVRLAKIVMSRQSIDRRAAALHLALMTEAIQAKVFLDFPIAEVAIHLERFGPMELKRLFWQMVDALEENHESFRGMRYFLVAGNKEFKSWHAMAHGGLSSALSRTVTTAHTNASLWSMQAVTGGALRRSLVVLHTHNPALDVLAVDVRTTGLQSLSDKDTSGDEEPTVNESLSAKLFINGPDGVRTGGLTLFTGQAELLSHVWSGTASSPLRAAILCQSRDSSVKIPSVTGVVLTADVSLTVLLDLTAQAQVSLWNKVADTKLNLQAGVIAKAGISSNGWATLRADAEVSAAPALTVRAVIDFYEDVKLCVSANTHRCVDAHNITKTEEITGGTHRTLRVHNTQIPLEGVTLALDPQNNRVCCNMI